ncbi:MAG: nitrogen fixation protein NifH [Anaerolineae bacterium]|nr:nitrogen fixation protein NifH [Anaerolineae bacterium]
MAWQDRLKGDSLAWLLEVDSKNPGVRYFALRHLLDRPADDPEVLAARAALMASGPVPVILNAQQPEGYWDKPGGGYGKYRATAWQIIFLGDLGADPADERVRRGCDYLLDHTAASTGGFAASQGEPHPGYVLHCLTGNLLTSLIALGWLDDPRTQRALEWEAKAITGEDPSLYHKCASSGPDFACEINGKLPCGWGATKAMKALAAVPPAERDPLVQRAVERGAAFLLRYDLAKAEYPTTDPISPSWFKLGFPLSYWSDLLETLTVLLDLGYAGDPRLEGAYGWLLNEQDEQGRWALLHTVNSRMWTNIERQGKPSKWITLRALRAIKAMETGKSGL